MFKTKWFLVPVAIIGLALLGAGIGYVTTKLSASNSNSSTQTTQKVTSQNPIPSNHTLGDSTSPTADDSTTTPSDNPTTTKPKPSSSSNSSSSNSSSNPNPSTPTCDTNQQAAYLAQYNNDVAAENDLYAANQNDPSTDPTTEDARHNAALLALQQTYQSQLASIYCN